jgi:hypothetical protein
MEEQFFLFDVAVRKADRLGNVLDNVCINVQGLYASDVDQTMLAEQVQKSIQWLNSLYAVVEIKDAITNVVARRYHVLKQALWSDLFVASPLSPTLSIPEEEGSSNGYAIA